MKRSLKVVVLAMVGLCLLVTGVGIARAQSGAPATTRAATGPAYRQGLLYTVYKLPRRPKGFRRMLPGLSPAAVGILPALDFRGPAALGGLDNSIQVEIAGELHIDVAGEYAFDAWSDDGMDLYVNDAFVLEDRWANGSAPPNRVTRTLAAGWTPIRIRLFQGDGGMGLTLKWKRPGSAEFVPIAPAALRVAQSAVDGNTASTTSPATSPATTATTAPAESAYRAVFASQGFFELPEAEGDLLLELLEGPTTLSRQARRDLNNLLSSIDYGRLPSWHQVKVLAGFLRGWYSGSTDRGAVTLRSAHTIGEAERVEHYPGWNNADRAGWRHPIDIAGHRVTLYTPASDSPERERVALAIAGLPQGLRTLIRTVKVEPYGTASEFNGGGDTIWVRLRAPATLESLDSTFSHEVGHVLMSKVDCYLRWEAAVKEDVLSTSHYGRLNPSEDFAEFVRLYVGTQGDPKQIQSLRLMFPARMRVLEQVTLEAGFTWDAKH
jgi:hypothetical protein